MLGYSGAFGTEQISDLLLRQPHGIIHEANLEFHRVIRLIKYYFVGFHANR